MKALVASLLFLVFIRGGLVACLPGWTKVSGFNREQAFVFNYNDGEDLQPCKYSFKSLRCEAIDHILQILRPLATTREKYPSINAFRLENSTLRFLPAEVFKGQNFQEITIFDTILTALTDSDLAFVGLEHKLKHLKFQDVVLHSGWDWSVFSKLSSVKELDVSFLKIETLDKVPNDNLVSLETVTFWYTEMTELHPEVFQNFHNLKELKVNNNHIKSIKRAMFPNPAYYLWNLDLRNNEIETLPDDMFTDMPKLRYIKMVDNKLLTLKEEVFKPVRDRDISIYLYGNHLQCDCRLLWIVNHPLVVKKNLFMGLSAYCNEPQRLKGKELNLLKSEDLYC